MNTAKSHEGRYMVTDTVELEPCPSCGEKHDLHIVLVPMFQQYFVMCWKCDYEARAFSNKGAAIHYWNSIKRETIRNASS